MQLADFGACALLERVEASAVMSESHSQASLDGGASCDGGSSPLPPQVPPAGRLAAQLRCLQCWCLPGCGIIHACHCLPLNILCYIAEHTCSQVASFCLTSMADSMQEKGIENIKRRR